MNSRYSSHETGWLRRRNGSSQTLWRGPSLSKAKLGSRMARADRLVIGVEKIGKGRVERTVAGVERAEDEGLEKPAGVRQMPLRRAGVGHRLDRLVLGRQIGGQRLALAADGFEPVALRTAVVGVRRLRHGCIEQLGSPV